MRPKYAVLCRLVDCEDDWGLWLMGRNDSEGHVEFESVAEARKAMKTDYEGMSESYGADWTVDGKDHCVRKVGRDEISLDVPIWDGENDRESWIRARWKVVKI